MVPGARPADPEAAFDTRAILSSGEAPTMNVTGTLIACGRAFNACITMTA
jgi:hypothetical protein